MSDQSQQPPSRHIRIAAPTINIRISPLGFHTYATQFLDAARALDTPKWSPVPSAHTTYLP